MKTTPEKIHKLVYSRERTLPGPCSLQVKLSQSFLNNERPFELKKIICKNNFNEWNKIISEKKVLLHLIPMIDPKIIFQASSPARVHQTTTSNSFSSTTVSSGTPN